MIPLRRHPGEGRTRYQRRVATTRALEAYVAGRKQDRMDGLFDALTDELNQPAAMVTEVARA